MQAATLRVELRFPLSRSLKDKRSVLRPIIEYLRRSASVAEVDHQDSWQRACLGLAVVARTQAAVDHLISQIGDYLESNMQLEVVEIEVSYLEDPR